jgi:single-strand DNA-binding protein
VANGLNKLMLIGNLGRDPEMRYLPSGKAVTNMSVAVGRRWTDAGGQAHEETEWFAVVLYDPLADIANRYLAKGRRVYVEGRLHTRTWDGEDGQKHTRIEVIANELVFLDAPRQQEGAPIEGAAPEPASSADDLPF